ncbi:hypothetical protein DFH08DRAFT_944071 [Mycena albidolilacea]|uniref:Uncharacterized protein n=1 Tax=Mycena albidolilacea TaxID=1033008 RepID=A0AAD6Z7Q3_9AGAR|nr:hypothetical protein DFH08DRAFT_944071 [Mycena albidolilacea]
MYTPHPPPLGETHEEPPHPEPHLPPSTSLVLRGSAPERLAGASIAPPPIPFRIRNTITVRGMAGAQAAETVHGNDRVCGYGAGVGAVEVENRYAVAEHERRARDTVARLPILVLRYTADKETDGRRPCVSPSCAIASCGARRARLPSSRELGAPTNCSLPPGLPVLGSPTHLRWERRAGSLREARSHKGETAVDVPEMGSTEPRTGGVGDEEMRGGVAEAQGCVGVDGEKSPSVERMHNAGNDCTYWSRDVGAEASGPREGRRGEADKDRLAEDRRLGRESEAEGDKPRSGSILARASIPQYEARAHLLPNLCRLAAEHLERSADIGYCRRSLARHTMRIVGRMLDGASAEGKGVASHGRPASEGARWRLTKAGAEEREARRSRGGDNEDSGAQQAEEGTREVEWCSRRIDGKWSVSGVGTRRTRSELGKRMKRYEKERKVRVAHPGPRRTVWAWDVANRCKITWEPQSPSSRDAAKDKVQRAAALIASRVERGGVVRLGQRKREDLKQHEHDITIDEVMLSPAPNASAVGRPSAYFRTCNTPPPPRSYNYNQATARNASEPVFRFCDGVCDCFEQRIQVVCADVKKYKTARINQSIEGSIGDFAGRYFRERDGCRYSRSRLSISYRLERLERRERVNCASDVSLKRVQRALARSGASVLHTGLVA